MAGINDFLKEKWTVNTPLPRALSGLLPAKGCTISFQQEDPKACFMVATSAKVQKRFEGFKLKNGRLERQIPDTDKVVVIEHGKPLKGGKRAKPRLKGWLKLGNKTMQGTWGAEAGSGSGGGGGGAGNTHPAGSGADAT